MHRDYEAIKARIVIDADKLSVPCRKAVFADTADADRVARTLLKVARVLDTNPRLRCTGLAAPQLGYNLRVIVVKNARGMFIPYVNPTIIEFGSVKIDSTEGCFSFPGKTATVKRSRTIMITADGLDLRVLRGMEAIAFQHEVDHLNGVLI